MTTAEDILAFIEANQDDDTARLAYADFLDEQAREPTPRGELIRVQCELWRLGFRPKCPKCDSYGGPCNTCEFTPAEDLKRREHELLTQHAAGFRRGPQCERCHGKKKIGPNAIPAPLYYECRVCHGTGYLGGLLRRNNVYHRDDGTYEETEWLHTVDFVRGFPRVHCRMEECVQEERVRCDHGCHFDNPKRIGWKHRTGCPQCLGQGRVLSDRTVPTDWLLSVVRHHRGVEVWVTDRVPADISEDCWAFDSWGCLGDYPHYVHHPILCAAIGKEIRLGQKAWKTKEAAQVALARAIPAWTRGYLK